MEKTTFAANFQVCSSKSRKNGRSPINLIITLNGNRASISTHMFIKPENWDSKKQKAKGNSDEAKAINDYLQQVRIKLIKKETELLEHGYIVTANSLRDAYLDKIAAFQSKTLLQLFRDFLDTLTRKVGIKISDATYYIYCRSFELTKEYINAVIHRDDVQLFELNINFIENFDIYLRSEYSQTQNTAIKYLKCLKHVINIANENGYLQSNPFATYKTPRQIVDKPFLTELELRAIINKDFQIKRIERVRDIFIFACFTGLSFSDVKTLEPCHFQTDDQGRVWIKKRRVKTGVQFRVPLLPIAKMILDKYKGGKSLLPVIDISSTDAYLKEIADICGIDKRISFHTARFTFATTVTLTNRVSMEVVSKMLGHTTTKMTAHYAKIVDEYIGKEMDELSSTLDKMKTFEEDNILENVN